MDILDVTFLLNDSGEQRVPLITSLVTPEAKRGQWHASRILREFELQNPSSIFFLYSDVGAKFYQRLGYVEHPLAEIIEAVAALDKLTADARPITLEQFSEKARAQCIAWVKDQPGTMICLPDAHFTDWHIERYRSFAASACRTLPPDLFWRVDHEVASGAGRVEHVVAGVPDFLALQYDCLWLTPGCSECLQFVHGLARRLELPMIRYWSHGKATGDEDCIPMVKTVGASVAARLLTPQICTWF